MELILFVSIIGGIIWVIQATIRRSKPSSHEPKDFSRQDCYDIVAYFHRAYGQFARRAISRERLEQVIDLGWSPFSIALEIAGAMDELSGLHLGDCHDPLLKNADGKPWKLPIKLPKDVRSKHMYLIGATGSGKTTLMLHLMKQDLENGEGFALIAPDSEFFEEEVLPSIPEHRLNDVVYFNPQDDAQPVCFNPFEVEAGEDLVLRSEDTFTILARAVSSLGARAEPILRNAIYALTALPDATINDLPRLINPRDPALREQVLSCEHVDAQTKQFFAEVFPTYPKDAHLPIINRFDLILRGRVARFLSGTSISFSEIMDERKIFLANLSTGLLGDEPSKLMGQLLVSKFLTTAYKRDSIPKAQRTPFYLYVDEFQTYAQSASATYSEILARARKYGLGLILAHQQTKQIDPTLLEDILGNVATTGVMRVGDRDAKRFKSVLYTGSETDEAQYIQRQVQEFPPGKVYVKLSGQQAVLVQSPFVEGNRDPEWRDRVKEASRSNYGLSLTPEPAQNAPDCPEGAPNNHDDLRPSPDQTPPLEVASARVSASEDRATYDDEAQPRPPESETTTPTNAHESEDLSRTRKPSYDEDDAEDFEFLE